MGTTTTNTDAGLLQLIWLASPALPVFALGPSFDGTGLAVDRAATVPDQDSCES